MSFLFDLVGLVRRNYTARYPPTPPKEPEALRIGILGAANIAPAALILPARSHPDVVVASVAARDPARAAAFAKKHGIPRVFATYQELLDDPDIDAVYNPLPNGLHYEWTMKAIKAGKHVLLEKPSCDTADETRRAFEFAREKGVVLLEAFHYRFHPATRRVRELVQSGELGPVTRLEGVLALPNGFFPRDDVRWNWAMGGGCMMDMGVYPLSFARLLLGAEPTVVVAATAEHAHTSTADAPVDRRTTALLAFPGDVTASITCDAAAALPWGAVPRVYMRVECARGSVHIDNFVQPTYYHYITVTRAGRGTVTEKIYSGSAAPLEQKVKGEEWWTTYRYQLEAFVDQIRGRTPDAWMTAEDSIAQMEAVESIYEKTGLGLRPASTYAV